MKFFLAIILLSFTQQRLHCQSSCDTSKLEKEKCIGMTVEQYKAKTSVKNKLVLINFKADWCIVCRKQDHIINAIKIAKKDQLELIIIDMDANPLISEYFEVNGLPIHKLYKNGILLWDHTGLLSEQEIYNAIRPFE